MRSFILFLSAVTTITSASAQYGDWKKLSIPEPAGSKYAFVDFNDSLHGLLCTADGYFTLTSDGGQSWTPVVKTALSGTVRKVKMADTGTALLLAAKASFSDQYLYKISSRGSTVDSMRLSHVYGGSDAVSICNKAMIGYISRNDTTLYFVSTKNFGVAWDSIAVNRRALSAIPSVAAADSATIFFGGSSGGNISGAYLYRSDDGGKTLLPLESWGYLSDVTLRIYTRELAGFVQFYYNDMRGWYSLLRYNIRSRQSVLDSIWYDASREGTVLNDGTRFVVSTGSHLVPATSGCYTLSDNSVITDSLQYADIAITGKQFIWYLTKEGRLFTNADNPLLPQGYFPLQIGNLWQYESVDPMHPDRFQTKITGDTLLENGKRYAVFSGGMLGSPFLRQEGSKLYGYDIVDAEEYLIGDYAARANDTLSQHRSARFMLVAGGKRTNNPSTWRSLEYMNIGPGSYVLNDWTVQDSIGLVRIMQEPGNAWSLSGAIIDGKTIGTITAVAGEPNLIPSVMSLNQNYPNPFNPSTTISFDVPKASRLRLAVYDLLGREVAVLADGVYPAGRHEAVFHAATFASGIYIYRLSTEGFTSVKKMLLTK